MGISGTGPRKVSDTEVARYVQDWEPYLWAMANRFSKPPELSSEDLHAVGCIIVWEALEWIDPSEDPGAFRRCVKTWVPRKFSDELRSVKCGARSADSTVRESDFIEDLPDGATLADLGLDEYLAFRSPEENAIWSDIVERVKDVLTEDELLLLQEFLTPSDIVLAVFSQIEYQRKPTKIPKYVVRQALGWSDERFHVSLSGLRNKLAPLLGD